MMASSAIAWTRSNSMTVCQDTCVQQSLACLKAQCLQCVISEKPLGNNPQKPDWRVCSRAMMVTVIEGTSIALLAPVPPRGLHGWSCCLMPAIVGHLQRQCVQLFSRKVLCSTSKVLSAAAQTKLLTFA